MIEHAPEAQRDPLKVVPLATRESYHLQQTPAMMFHGRTNEAPIPASIKVDVSDVARTLPQWEDC